MEEGNEAYFRHHLQKTVFVLTKRVLESEGIFRTLPVNLTGLLPEAFLSPSRVLPLRVKIASEATRVKTNGKRNRKLQRHRLERGLVLRPDRRELVLFAT